MVLHEVVWVKGPVVKSCGELAVFIEMDEDASYSECLKVVISDSLAQMSQIEVGDLVCLRTTEGRFKLEPVKARNIS